MENHPIPQDVTGFQFKLIGNMTVRQFAYLAGGSIMAWIFFSLPFPGLIKYPLAFFFALLGAGLAFLPIEQRPMDVMLKNFIRALFNPNQYVFQKTGGTLVIQVHSLPQKTQAKQVQSLPREKLEKYLRTMPKHQNKIDDKESNFLSSLSNIIKGGGVLLQTQAPASGQSSPPKNTPPRIITVEEDRKKDATTEVPEETQTKKLAETQKTVADEGQKKAEPQKEKPKPVERPITAEEIHQKALDLQQQLNEALLAKQKLEEQLISMQKRVNPALPGAVFTPSGPIPPVTTPNVRTIPQDMEKNAGLPISPSAPNLITGIVKDPRGNILSNILVEIKDQDQNPVRAFKTNALGQFAAVTPLLNGTYTIAFEDPAGKNQFDAVQIIAKGEIITPLEVTSTDQREQLRKELFG